MDFRTATPAEIDTELARIYNDVDQAETEIERARRTVDRIDNASGYERELPWYTPAKRAEAEETIEHHKGRIASLRHEARPLEARYADERWNRYFLVTNTGGHVHSSTACETCFVTTQFAWLTEQSGMSHEALVDLAGEAACTVCFPSAPVNVLKQRSRLEAPERKAAREQREAEKAERLAKKIAKGLTEDGSEFVVEWFAPGRRFINREWVDVPNARHIESFKTERAASMWYVDQHYYAAFGGSDLTAMRPAFEQIERAIAAKHGKTIDEVKADFERKLQAKNMREGR